MPPMHRGRFTTAPWSPRSCGANIPRLPESQKSCPSEPQETPLSGPTLLMLSLCLMAATSWLVKRWYGIKEIPIQAAPTFTCRDLSTFCDFFLFQFYFLLLFISKIISNTAYIIVFCSHGDLPRCVSVSMFPYSYPLPLTHYNYFSFHLQKGFKKGKESNIWLTLEEFRFELCVSTYTQINTVQYCK